MQQLEWTEHAYGTGVAEIDQQHRELFDRVNALLAACAGSKPEREVRLTLDFLSQYVITHFLFEEKWMRTHGCTGCAENEVAHRQFVDKLSVLKDRHRRDGVAPNFLEELSRFLLRWMGDHVERVDVAHLRMATSVS